VNAFTLPIRIRPHGLQRQPPAFLFHQDRHRPEGLEDFFIATDLRPAHRRRAASKRFVQVQVHYVDAKIAGRVTPVKAFMFAPSM